MTMYFNSPLFHWDRFCKERQLITQTGASLLPEELFFVCLADLSHHTLLRLHHWVKNNKMLKHRAHQTPQCLYLLGPFVILNWRHQNNVVFLEEISGYPMITAEESQHGMRGTIILTGWRVTLQSDFQNLILLIKIPFHILCVFLWSTWLV